MPAHFDSIVSLIYDGITTPDEWQKGLEAINNALDGIGFHHFVMSAQSFDVHHSNSSTELPPSKVHEYEVHYARDDPRAAQVFSLPPGQVMLDSEHFDARTVSRTPIFVDWLLPIGIRDTLSVKLRCDTKEREFLAFFRSTDHSHPLFNTQNKAFFEHVLPHLCRASTLRARMSDLALHAYLGLNALEQLPQGLVIVDIQGRIQYLNPAAQTVLNARAALISAKQGILALIKSDVNQALHQLIQMACHPLGAVGAGTLNLPIDGNSHLGISVQPLHANHPLASLQQRPLALVMFTDSHASASAAQLGELLGITPTEARLAAALAAGTSLRDFAITEHCSWHTARTHIKNLLRKTNCHRQVDLVRLIKSLPLTMR